MTNSEKTAAHFTLYTKPACPQCVATKRWLTKRGWKPGEDFPVIDAASDPSVKLALQEMGVMQMPAVLAEFSDGSTTLWTGFQPSKLEEFIGTKESA